MTVDNRSPEEYRTLDDPVCDLNDNGCGGTGFKGQSPCDQCDGTGRRKTAATSFDGGDAYRRRRRE